jgi:hypothetical protein
VNLADLTLVELAAVVSASLKEHGIDVVIVGGSAITSHVPNVYTSMDIDFAVTSGLHRREITAALEDIGFHSIGRSFAHPDTIYTLDFVADMPSIDAELVEEFTEVVTSQGNVRVYYIEDAIADRVAAFLHWSDSQSLDVAERAAAAARERISPERLRKAFGRLDPRGADSIERLELARDRIAAAIRG